jgi:hypothetical protein
MKLVFCWLPARDGVWDIAHFMAGDPPSKNEED